jgi:ubiquinone/menaquinone biosynthesis C-methylase UbiE
MKTKQEILEAITQLTFEIETENPELYRYLDEAPETLPSQEHPKMDAEALNNYLEGLNQLYRKYKETHTTLKK